MPEQDLTLMIVGGAGLIAMVIAVFVFAVTARRFVSSDHDRGSTAPATPEGQRFDAAQDTHGRDDRRSGNRVDFPLTVNGTVIPYDRRRN